VRKLKTLTYRVKPLSQLRQYSDFDTGCTTGYSGFDSLQKRSPHYLETGWKYMFQAPRVQEDVVTSNAYTRWMRKHLHKFLYHQHTRTASESRCADTVTVFPGIAIIPLLRASLPHNKRVTRIITNNGRLFHYFPPSLKTPFKPTPHFYRRITMSDNK
jgi:hypothetical protein